MLVLTVAQYNQYITLHLAVLAMCLTASAVGLIQKIAVCAKQLMCAEQPCVPINQTSQCIVYIASYST